MENKIEIKTTEETYKGIYANNAVVMHTESEFILDFMSIFPPKGLLGARLIMTPGTMKRVTLAMQENLARYEQQYGEIKLAAPPDPQMFTH